MKSVSRDNTFRDYVLEQLSGVPRVHARAMFGGVGFYADEVFFGLIAAGALYFKVDDSTRGPYQAAGMPPFRPYPDKPASASYFQVPVDVLEDAGELTKWAQSAMRVAAVEKPKRRGTRRAK